MRKPYFFQKKGKVWQIPEGGQIIERLYKGSLQEEPTGKNYKSKQNIIQGNTGGICIKKKNKRWEYYFILKKIINKE